MEDDYSKAIKKLDVTYPQKTEEQEKQLQSKQQLKRKLMRTCRSSKEVG
ncbi:hypothetical protein [Oenococcus oeni]